MLFKRGLILSLLLVLIVIGRAAAQTSPVPVVPPSAYTEPTMDHPREVVLSLSERDPARVDEVLSNIGNIQKFYGTDNVRIELVVYGPGVHAVLKDESKVQARIRSLVAIGIDISACKATLDTLHKSTTDLIAGVKVVPNGIPEIIERQAHGWIYVRP